MKKIISAIILIPLLIFGFYAHGEISEANSVKSEKFGAITRIKLGSVNIFLLKAAGGYLLIDTAFAESYGDFKNAMKSLDIEPSEIRYILLTHHHDDHAGFAADLVRESGATLIVHEKALGPLAQGKSLDDVLPANLCTEKVFKTFTALKEKKYNDFAYPPVHLRRGDIVIKGDNGSLLKSIGIEGKILYTPGHTDDSLSVILADGSAFVGDVAMNIMGICGLNHRPIYAKNMSTVFRSWEKLLSGGAIKIYTSHGEPFDAENLNQ